MNKSIFFLILAIWENFWCNVMGRANNSEESEIQCKNWFKVKVSKPLSVYKQITRGLKPLLCPCRYEIIHALVSIIYSTFYYKADMISEPRNFFHLNTCICTRISVKWSFLGRTFFPLIIFYDKSVSAGDKTEKWLKKKAVVTGVSWKFNFGCKFFC